MFKSALFQALLNGQAKRLQKNCQNRKQAKSFTPTVNHLEVLEERTLLSGVGSPVDPPTYQETFNDNDASDFEQNDPGNWTVANGQYEVDTSNGGGVGTSTIDFHGFLPTDFEMSAEVTSVFTAGSWHDGFLIFDYQGENNFKYAGFFAGQNEFVIGHYEGGFGNRLAEVDWDNEGRKINTDQAYTIHLRMVGNTVEMSVDGEAIASATFSGQTSLNGGALGMAAINAVTQFDNFIVSEEVFAGRSFVPVYENFEDTQANDFTPNNPALWSVENLGDNFVYQAESNNPAALATSLVDVYGTISEEFVISADITAISGSNRWGDGFIIFDYVSPTDFKYAGMFVGQNQFVIGHYQGHFGNRVAEIDLDNNGETINPDQTYHLQVQVDGNQVYLSVDGKAVLSGSFGSSATLNQGQVGVMAYNAVTQFDNFKLTPPPKDAGDTVPDAHNFGVLSESVNINGHIGTDGFGHYDAKDIYKFTISEDSTVTIDLAHISQRVHFQLYQNIDGDALLESNERIEDLSPSNAVSMVEALSAGDYYVVIGAYYNPTNTPYSLSFSQTPLNTPPVADPGDTPATSTDLGTLGASPVAVKNVIGGGDVADTYKFEITQDSTVTIDLAAINERVHFQLFQNIDGDALFESNERVEEQNPSGASSMVEALAAGEYFIVIHKYYDNSNTEFDLTVSQTPLNTPPVADPGDTPATSTDLGTLGGSPVSVKNVIGGGDAVDTYKFEITQDSTVTIDLATINERVHFQLFQNIDGDALFEANEIIEVQSPSGASSMVEALAAGEYFIVIHKYYDNSNTEFDLTVSQTPLNTPPVADPGDTPATSTDLGTLGGSPVAVKNVIGGGDTLDAYRFEIAQDATVTIDLAGINERVHFRLYQNIDGDALFESNERIEDHSPSAATSIVEALSAGEYFIVIQKYYDSSNTAFDLTVSQTPLNTPPVTDPGDTPGTSTDLGTLGASPVAVKNVIGGGDTLDAYRFEIAQDATVTIDLAGINERVHFRLYQNIDGDALFESNERIEDHSPSAATSIVEALAAGEYFIVIQKYYDSSNTAFDLTVSQTPTPPASLTDSLFSNNEVFELI